MAVDVWIHIQVLYSIPLVSLPAFVPVLCCFYCYVSVVWFEAGYCDTASVALLAQYCLVYSRSLVLPNEL
jgi:hypothetical protein